MVDKFKIIILKASVFFRTTCIFMGIFWTAFKLRRKLAANLLMPKDEKIIMWDLLSAAAWYTAPATIFYATKMERQKTPRGRPVFPWAPCYDQYPQLDAHARALIGLSFLILAIETATIGAEIEENHQKALEETLKGEGVSTLPPAPASPKDQAPGINTTPGNN